MRTLELSDEQYETLLKTAYLGEWVLNSLHSADEETPFGKKSYEMLQHLFNQSEKFNLKEDYKVDIQSEIGPSEKFEDELDEYIQYYNEANFWSTLSNKLAERDIISIHGEEIHDQQIEDWADQYEEEIDEIQLSYLEEFQKNGLWHLHLVDEDDDDSDDGNNDSNGDDDNPLSGHFKVVDIANQN